MLALLNAVITMEFYEFHYQLRPSFSGKGFCCTKLNACILKNYKSTGAIT
jgi:hypothetical protein